MPNSALKDWREISKEVEDERASSGIQYNSDDVDQSYMARAKAIESQRKKEHAAIESKQMDNARTSPFLQFLAIKKGYYLLDDNRVYYLEKKPNKWYQEMSYDENNIKANVFVVGFLREKEGATKFKCFKNKTLQGEYSLHEVLSTFKNAKYLGNNIRETAPSGFTDMRNNHLNCSFDMSIYVQGGRTKIRSPRHKYRSKPNYRSKRKTRSNSSRT